MNTYRPATGRGRAAIYARTSTDNQDVGLSTATQIEMCQRQAEMMGFTVHPEEDVYMDGGISGMEDERPEFRALMLKIFSPERLYEALFVNDISRVSRSTGSYINYEEIFAEEGIELISLMDPPSNTPAKIDTGRRMKAVMNEAQVVDSAVKTRNSQMFAVEMGFYIGWIQPFGYRKKKVMWRGKEHTKLEPDPETWPHLLHIKEMAKNGHSLNELRQYLHGTGMRHPAETIDVKKRGKAGKRGNGRFTNDNLSYLLKNKALLGWTFRGGEHSGTKILKQSEEVICRGAHEAAMTWEERELIISKLASRRRQVKNPRTHRSPNPLSELVVCGVCGATMRMHTEKGTQRLICANKRDHQKSEPEWCPNLSVRLDRLMERTTEAIMGHILTPRVLQQQVRMVAKENREFVGEDT